jgi:hypothetical protein
LRSVHVAGGVGEVRVPFVARGVNREGGRGLGRAGRERKEHRHS